ncbi:hypothetical protein GPJ56_009506 [Histomonas meleagridis]|uniref:uncharacterized protein n=1 Tax=Histomonas meleagridis TaxID=135588 RepID=UPI003559E900|nr:hypothetical protein GPJ56_009506 [Histomonas meleagridis]KAH0804647.1 hypothetical protein GO595_002583 [Histomonas meleagridis]
MYKSKFQECEKLIKSYEKLRQIALEIIESEKVTFGVSSTEIIDSQPDFKSTLSSIFHEGTKIANNTQNFLTEFSEFPKQMQKIKDLYSAMYKQSEYVKSLNKSAAKQRDVAKKAEASLEKARTQGKEAEIAKCEAKYASAQDKANTETQKADEEQLTFANEELKYKVNFTQELVTILTNFINLKMKLNDEIKSSSSQITAQSSTFTVFDDPSIAALQQELEELESVVIE